MQRADQGALGTAGLSGSLLHPPTEPPARQKIAVIVVTLSSTFLLGISALTST